MHPILYNVFQALQHAHIRWCLLRGEDALNEPGGDVDLLVAPTDMPRLRRLLAQQGFGEQTPWGHGSHTFWLRYDPPSDCWLKLDLVTELAYGPYFMGRTGAAAGCLTRAQRDGVVATLAPDDAFWSLLLHCLLDKGSIAPHYRQRLVELAQSARSEGAWARLVAQICPALWTPTRLLACVRQGDWSGLEQLAPLLQEAWVRQHRVAGWWRRHGHRQLRRWDWRLGGLRKRGLSVALLGPDGAGKSTLASGIEASFPLPVRRVYMGLWQRSTRSVGARLPGLDLATGLLTSWGRFSLAQYHQIRGRLVIFDRYTYDALLTPRRNMPVGGRLYFWLLGHACPPPDLVLVLDAPGDLMYQRKHEHDPAQLELQRQRFLGLRQVLPRLEVVDAARPADVVRREVIDRIWRRYHALGSRD